MLTLRTTTKWGEVSVHLDMRSVPILKLLKWHAPAFRIECWITGTTHLVLVPLSMIDLDSVRHIEENTDRAQLAKLGESAAAIKR